jgi:dihydroxyacetone kinase
MKKLINRPDRVVQEMMQGLAAMYPDTLLLPEAQALIRADAHQLRDHQVALISGGGSGHEPAHAGYVGQGMLTGAVAGEVFTSPSPDAVFATIRAIGGKAGVLLIVKNYTGDRLNFGLAAEMARAEGTPVTTVIVADDVALAKTAQKTGARGLAGTVLVHKIAGAAAEAGRSLSEVASLAQAAADDIVTMGLALSAGIVPAAGKASFLLGPDELELGLGIHGEPGVRRDVLRSADEMTGELIDHLLSARTWRPQERIALLINNLGATTNMELAIASRHALHALSTRGLLVQRVYAGAFLTSLEAAGISLSLLRVDEERLRLLDTPTAAPAWPNAARKAPAPLEQRTITSPSFNSDISQAKVRSPAVPGAFVAPIQAACRAIQNAEVYLTDLDRLTGDGDLGTNLARGARALEERLSQDQGGTPAEALQIASRVLQRTVGGSSGPFYAVLLLRVAHSLAQENVDEASTWVRASLAGCEAISELGGAKAGDRTILDALLPFSETLALAVNEGEALPAALNRAAAAAEQGAAATASMMPRFGRASYLGERALGHPDAGAVAASLWLRAVANALRVG